MKQITKKEFNNCKTRPEADTCKATKIKLIAVIGTQEISSKELYEIDVHYKSGWDQKQMYYIQRFVKDKENENTIILRCRYK